MRGAVNINTSPPAGRRENTTYRGSQPCLRLRRASSTSFSEIRSLITTWRHLQKLKSEGAGNGSPTTVLFESQWTTAFPGRARGDRVTPGPWAEAVGHRLIRILTL